jgi:hypothetical protein
MFWRGGSVLLRERASRCEMCCGTATALWCDGRAKSHAQWTVRAHEAYLDHRVQNETGILKNITAKVIMAGLCNALRRQW